MGKIYLLVATALLCTTLYGQQSTVTSAPVVEYPTKIAAYIGIVHPIVTFAKGSTRFNFKDYYQMGVTTAVIVRKSPKYAYSLEVVGFVRAEDGSSKSNNLMLHPGVTFYGKKNFAITPRFGFESSGRYGPGIIFTQKAFKLGPHVFNANFVNLLRFGNNVPASYTFAFNFTCGF